MWIDLTLPITPSMITSAQSNEQKALTGHLGTHFDVMNKVFPLDYLERPGIIFDVSHAAPRDIDLADINLDQIQPGMFVAIYTGYIEHEPYGTPAYFQHHPQLSHQLINALLDKQVAIIAIDCAGIRRGSEHTPTDQICADRNVFIVENICNLRPLLDAGAPFTAHTYPLNQTQATGLPCRVVAEFPD